MPTKLWDDPDWRDIARRKRLAPDSETARALLMAVATMTPACEGCGRALESETIEGAKVKRYCSPACQRRAHRSAYAVPADSRRCTWCRKSFRPVRRSDARYCSPKCRVAAYRQRERR